MSPATFMRGLVFAGCLALFAAGCDEQKAGPAPATTVTVKAPATATATASPTATVAVNEPDAELDSEDLPVPEDFLDEAGKEITKDNLDAELDKIEKEMAQDKSG